MPKLAQILEQPNNTQQVCLFFFFTVNICIKQKDSILLTWVCSVMGLDHRGHQNNGQNISNTLACGLCAAFLFLPHFDDICDLLLPEQTHGDMESVC